ncbi:DNA annealing helicase and endonuclease ZRANB3 isoform X2 [Mangifera indica]|uniref:DNA annealing helicase and endonuclease ZRANB3 isoform X2 n=1 Tax=Mangifera indica TaxID=29780 RepID=UPI001CF9ADC2|nr:DNA annealing helicase and endonuclease ZRANB3 isoform X2 [Mangifera indica]
MEITEEQRKRAEANRLAALAKRKAIGEFTVNQQQQKQNNQEAWRLFKCRKLSVESSATTKSTTITHSLKPCPNVSIGPDSRTHLPEKFRVKLEICSPDSFSVTPEAVQRFSYPGEEECLRRVDRCLSDVMPSHYTQNSGGGKACVYKLADYNAVFTCLKNSSGIEVEGVPWVTLNVIEKLSHSFSSGRWNPCRPEHFSEEIVDEMIGKLPKRLVDVLLPFQLEGVRFGLRRGGRCLIADEMGLGKTLQAIAIAACFMNEGSILVVCPAVLRLQWAEELEHWLPFCLPADVHLVFGHENNPAHLTRFPRVVVISYKMLHHLRKSMTAREWALLIVDESHHIRCSKRTSEPEEVKAVLEVAAKVKRIVLLSGTPSLSRPYDIFHQINMLWPGLLGKNKYEFAKTYCDVKVVKGYHGRFIQDFSRGVRLEELNVLLKQTVMIRRLKQHVLVQLPPKRRQIIRLFLKRSDMLLAKATVGMSNGCAYEKDAAEDMSPEDLDEPDDNSACSKSEKLSHQELGVAKLSGFREWLSLHPLLAESDGAANSDLNVSSNKMIIFAHHHKVLDGVQEFLCEKEIGFVRIDGNTLPRDRQSAVLSFRSSNEVKIAIIGITAGGVGLDFSSAQSVVFLEMPLSPSLMLQAEDRAHRRGQTSAVNIYIFCAKDTVDESHWQRLNRTLRRVSSTTNGKYDAVQEIVVEGVSDLNISGKTDTGCEDQTLDQVSSGKLSEELMCLPESSLTQDMQTAKENDEVTTNMNCKSVELSKIDDISNETDDLHIEADMGPELEIGKDYISREKEATLSVGEIGSPEKVSSSELVKGNKDKNQIEKEFKTNPQITEVDDVALLPPTEADECCSNEVNSLRFEVSQYTGRIHLFLCMQGEDSRPRPLFENFRQEELDNKERISESLKDNPGYRHAILEFISDWNKLRPIEQTKLLGKPLQLPLSVELCCLKETINHNTGGLLKGGSKRRTTPSDEISHPLPSDAVWKKIRIYSGFRKKEREFTQGWTLNNEPLCKLCQKPCKGNNAKTPEYFEDLFCNLGCYEEYRLRTSGRFLREELFQIEHGICMNCQLDCHKLVKHIKPLSLDQRQKYVEKVAPNVARWKNLLEKLVNDPTEGNAWHADHIIPVYRGGGECRLENMRTLCVACHYNVTKAQCAERRSTRAKARKQLKAIMSDISIDENNDMTGSYIKVLSKTKGIWRCKKT